MNKLSRYRKLRYNQLFESENRELRLNEMGNPLEVLSQYVDFEIFRPTLESALFTGERKSNAGRPPIDCVLMFKVLFLQRYYGLSDHQIEYQIVDRTSFRKFLGIECVDDVPDEKTVWKYRELLTNTGVYDKLFSEFHSFMESKGLQFNEGRIIDASFVIAPRQRNTRDENEQIKQGAGDKLWNDNPHKKCHKDVDARWTKKRDETFYGYKQHTKVEKRNKIILSYDTTSAEVHDSKGFEGLLDEKDEGKDLYLDAGYVGQEEIVKQHKMNPIICEKGYRNRPLTKEQKSDNRKKSKTRCLVEHVFVQIATVKQIALIVFGFRHTANSSDSLNFKHLAHIIAKLYQYLRSWAIPAGSYCLFYDDCDRFCIRFFDIFEILFLVRKPYGKGIVFIGDSFAFEVFFYSVK